MRFNTWCFELELLFKALIQTLVVEEFWPIYGIGTNIEASWDIRVIPLKKSKNSCGIPRI